MELPLWTLYKSRFASQGLGLIFPENSELDDDLSGQSRGRSGQAEPYPAFKSGLRRAILKFGGVRRIHIIGAARSGTTMLHYAMIAFRGVQLHDAETDVRWSPSLKDSIRLCVQSITSREPQTLVTKRKFGWYHGPAINRLIKHVVTDEIGLIHIVRDPRDSLTSRHSGRDDSEFYLGVDRWHDSVVAAERVFTCVGDRTPKLTIRYEDVIGRPEETEKAVSHTFGLRLREGISSWATLQDNIESLGVSTHMALAMHGVRNFDASSAGRGKLDPRKAAYFDSLLNDSRYRRWLERFMKTYRYEDSRYD